MNNGDSLKELGISKSLLRSLGAEGSTGRGVRVVVVDSGILSDHPHVGRLARGVRIDRLTAGEFRIEEDHTDSIGHGTACAGVIRLIAPACEIASVKILDANLLSSSDVLVRAIRWAVEEGEADVINLSLGTRNEKAVPSLRSVCADAGSRGAMVVAAAANDREIDYPAVFPDVIGVTSSASDVICASRDEPFIFYAPPYPRSIPHRHREDNFKGPSFAAARITGIVALMLESDGQLKSMEAMAILSQFLPGISRDPSTA